MIAVDSELAVRSCPDLGCKRRKTGRCVEVCAGAEAAAQRRGTLLECACTPRLHACTRSSAGTRTARPSVHVATAPYALQHNCTPSRRQATKSDPSVLSKGCIQSHIMCDVTRVSHCNPTFLYTPFFLGVATVFQWCWVPLRDCVVSSSGPSRGASRVKKPLSAWWALVWAQNLSDKTSLTYEFKPEFEFSQTPTLESSK